MGNKKKIGTRYKAYNTAKKNRQVKVSTASPSNPDGRLRPKVDSGSKAKLEGNLSYYDNKMSNLKYNLIDIDSFGEFIEEIAVCKSCHSKLKLSCKSVVGLVSEFNLICTSCGKDKSSLNSKSVSANDNVVLYDLNLRLVYGLRSIGKGYSAAKNICGIMNLPPPPTMYLRHEKVLADSTKTVCEQSMKLAVEEAVKENDRPEKRDLCVAVDGSWQKRGHVSLNGIVSLTSVDTGKVLDIHAMSKFCLCPLKEKKEHQLNCIANYLGTSGGMEVDGAIKLFHRSVSKYDVRYIDYLGDGDSNAYKSVSESLPYGPDVVIKKLECVGHVQKRMGTRLRTLKDKCKKEKLSDGKPLSGKNRLTTAAVQKLQTFYGLSIRRNTHSVVEMKKAVWATYFHVQSTNEMPTHQLCPNDELTWCKYKKAELESKSYDHGKHFHLPEAIMLKLKPIFKSLSDPELLAKCLKGKSQNPNESLNNLIWSRIPKRTFVRLHTLTFGAHDAVLSFNEGFSSKCKILEGLGLEVGSNMLAAMKKMDLDRLRKAEKAMTDLEKKIRQSRTLGKRRLEDIYQESEDPDNPSYGAGLH